MAPKGEAVFESIPSLLKAFIHFLVFIFCKNLLAHESKISVLTTPGSKVHLLSGPLPYLLAQDSKVQSFPKPQLAWSKTMGSLGLDPQGS